MNEETLPPSPNWYLSNVLACRADGTIAYGSRNNIVIAKYLPGNSASRTPQISLIPNAHKERITVISFSTGRESNNTYWNCLASAGDDSVIRVWSLEKLSLLLAHTSHVEGTKVSAMDWSKFDPNLVVSADESGSIVCWDLFSNTTQRLSFGKLVPTCLACCPHRRDLIAMGTRSGLVCTVSLKDNGKLLHRLRGHDSEVVSLSWSPVSYNVMQPKELQDDMLLASGAKEKAIYIWRAGGDGHYEIVLNLPVAPMSQETVGAQQHRSRLGTSSAGVGGGTGSWTCVLWPEPSTILSSSLWGELVSINIEQVASVRSNKQLTAKLWRLVHACHARGLFSIACATVQGCVNRMNAEENGSLNGNGLADNDLNNAECKENMMSSHVVWTAAQDRQLVACYLQTGEVVANIPTLGGFVYCIAASPLDSSRIAFGVGDGTIRVWNLSNFTSLEIVSLWQKIKGKVMALAWHPTNERWLAYGTSEGRIGIYDVSPGRQPILFRPFHHRSVYTLCWGPSVYKTGAAGSDGIFLYSCGDGEVVRYDPDKPDEEPRNLKDVLQFPDLNQKRSDIAWKPDSTLLAMGNEDGTVHIMSAPHLALIHTLFAHKKLIQCLAWHPESTATDTTYSPCRHWLAVASNETHIKVFDLAHLAKDNEQAEASQLKSISSCFTLSGHLSRVVSMCWSPHIGGQLVSVSYDDTAQVWNVPSQQAVANFGFHSSHVYCCMWCPFDPDLVMTGSSDCTLRMWRVSSQSNALPSERKKQKKLETKKVKTVPAANDRSNPPQPAEGADKDSVPVVPVMNPDNGAEFARSEKELCEASGAQVFKKKKKSACRKSFFPVSSQQQNQGKIQHLKNCYHLLAELNKSDSVHNEFPPYLGFFGNRDDMQKLLDEEVEHHSKVGNNELAHHIELWRGNVTEMLKEMARRKQLSDLLVSFAPMASQKLWLDMCRAYSEQLVLFGQYQKAASYLLVCHKVNEAIELLLNHQLFREALAIARSRLGPDDPIMTRIIREWGRDLASEGNYEFAAQCLISVGDLLEAAMLIRKRNDESSLKLAALIADKAGAQELASLLANQSMKQSLLVGKLDVANEVALQHAHLKHLSLLITVHQTIAELTAKSKSSLYLKWLHKCKYLPLEVTPLLELILSRWQPDFNREETEEIYFTLLKEFGANETADTNQKLWFAVSVELALSCMSDGAQRLRHLVSALGACYQYRQLHPAAAAEHLLLPLCIWLSPQGPFAEKSVFCTESNGELRYIARSLQAYLCAGIVDWASENLDTDNRMESTGTISGENGGVTEEIMNCDDCQNKLGQWHGVLEVMKISQNAVLAKESVQYFQDCVKIRKWEHEIATALAKSQKSVGDTVSAADGAGDNSDADNILSKLEDLKQRRQVFERDYISTPNPFVTYCKMKNLLCHIQEEDPESCDDLYEQFEALWKSITSHI